jgi:hypothetical protein
MPTLKTIATNGTNPQLQMAIERILPKAVAQRESKLLARKLRGANDYATSQNIFNWVLTNIKYKQDGSSQVIKLPSALMIVKEGDCKSMALLTASLLINNGITPKFVYTSYKQNDPTPSHIYVETDSGIILDPVWRRFNSEKKPAYKKKKVMNISYLSGVDGCESCSLGAIISKQKRQNVKQTFAKAKTQVKQATQKVSQGAKVVGLSAGRLLFLTMIKNNLDGMATKLSTGNQASQIATWKKAGGDASKFASAVKTGSQKPAKKFGFLGKLKKRLAKKKINGIFGGETDDDALKSGIRTIAVSTGALVGSSAPAVGTAVGGGAGASLGEVLIIILPMVKEMVLKTPATDMIDENASFNNTGQLESETPEEGAQSSSGDSGSNGGGGSASSTNKILLYGAVAVGGYLLYKNRKKLMK